MPALPTSCIDWLSYTVPWSTAEINDLWPTLTPELICSHVSGKPTKWVKDTPRHGYILAFHALGFDGLKVFLSEHGSVMGVHVQYSGSALQGENPTSRLAYASAMHGSITRLDIAVDVEEAWPIRDIYDAHGKRDLRTAARTASIIESATGKTCYIGSRVSEKYLRIYDKAGQLGLKTNWTRVELECKGEFARGVGGYLVAHGLNDIPRIICGYVDCPTLPYWVEAMSADVRPIAIPTAEHRKDTRKWLIESVAPSLARELLEDKTFYQAWSARMTVLMDGRVGEVGDIFDGAAEFQSVI